ncbi:hypothetical protein AGMMS50262_12620 [Bacteroidia bacterium]|nr:hypothetical protein AGMMS50262_12620 [Bacteroidia bacterium]
MLLTITSVKAREVTINTFEELKPAIEAAECYDIIIVSGEISSTEAITIERSIQIKGTMDAKIVSTGAGRIFNINVPNGYAYIESLTLLNGVVEGNGGAVVVNAGQVLFNKCTLSNNQCSGDGGAVYGEGEVQIEFYNCILKDNQAGNNGGAICMIKGESEIGPFLSMKHCVVSLNKSANGGGAMSLESTTMGVMLVSTIVDSNMSTEGAGGIRITGGSFSFYAQSCSFSRNMAYEAGFMTIAGDEPKAITFINSTIGRNMIAKDPDGCCIGNIKASGKGMDGTEITLVNVTMVENWVGIGSSGSNGAGWVFYDSGYVFHVYNSIIVGNASHYGYADVSCVAEPKEFTIQNSVVGWVDTQNDEVPYVIQDNPAIEAKSVVQEYNAQTWANWTEIDMTNGAGLFMQEGGAYRASSGSKDIPARGYYYYTFFDDALATRLGDPALLSEWDNNDDMLLKPRTITNRTIWAGAYQGKTENSEFGIDPKIPEYSIPVYVKANNIDCNAIDPVFSSKDYSVRLTDNYIEIYSSVSEAIQLTLYDPLGKIHYDRFFPTEQSIQIPKSLFPQGVYLLTIATGDKKQLQTIKIVL